MGARGFVGRERDLGELRAAMDAATAGQGSLVLVAGEAGIGKSRLAEELAVHARAVGARPLWGRCWEGDGAPAFWPWIQLVRDYLRDCDQDALRAQLGAGAADVARLVPEVAERFPDLPAAPAAGQEAARFRLFDAVAAFLRRAAAERPLLLVVDDLHWSDKPSLLLLGFLAAELRSARLLVVAAYRDVELDAGHPLAALLSTLTSEHRRLMLGGLSQAEVAELIDLVAGERLGAELAAAVYRETGGNPFFVREVLRLLASQQRPGSGPDAGAGLGLPHGVRAVLQRRLGQRSRPCAELLAAAAVLGQEFRLDLLELVAELPRARVAALLDEAAGARLVDASPGAVGSYRFAHALVREALYAGLGGAERAALHRRAGRAIERRFAGDLEPRLAELAHHYLQLAADGEAAKALEYATRAGRRSLELLAYEEAAGHFERALAVLELAWPADWARRAELLLALGRAQTSASELAAAHATYEQAAEAAGKVGDAALLARAALGLGLEFTVGIVDAVEVRLLEAALEALGDGDGPLRARVLARLAKALLFTTEVERRAELSEQAVAMARRLGDPTTLAAVLYDRHVAIWGSANAAERLAIAGEVVQLAERRGDRTLALQGRALRMGNLLELGEPQALAAEIDAYDHLTAELRLLHYRWHVPMLRASQAAMAGRFEEAERLAREGLALGQRAQHQGVTVFYVVVVSMVRFSQGRLGELEGELRHGSERQPLVTSWRASLAAALCQAGRLDEAREQFEWLAADGFAGLPRDFTTLFSLAFLAVVADALGDAARAGRLYELLLPYAACNVRISRIGVASLGAAAHYLGLLAATTGRWEEAARHFEAAIERNGRMGAVAFLANSRLQYARALRARGGPGDATAATAQADQALAAARTLGIRLWPPAAGAEPSTPLVRRATLRRQGDYWTVGYQGRTFQLKDAVGLRCIARLLAEPGHELHAADLDATGAGHPARAATLGDAGVVLDETAKAAYRRRLEELAEELAEAEAWADGERAARAKAEADALTDQLAAAVGLGGRDRRAASDAERARTRVTKAIRASVRRIAAQDAALGDHLTRSIRTGTFCAYAPDPAAPVSWTL